MYLNLDGNEGIFCLTLNDRADNKLVLNKVPLASPVKFAIPESPKHDFFHFISIHSIVLQCLKILHLPVRHHCASVSPILCTKLQCCSSSCWQECQWK